MIDRIYAKNYKRIEDCDIILRDGITVLTGRNGSGKSSIVESIIFNLFGHVEGNKDTIRRTNAKEDELTVTCVDFEIGDRHYRCRRWLTKKLSTMATLYMYTQEEYKELLEKDKKNGEPLNEKDFGTEIATSTNGVTNAIAELLGTDRKGFKASFVAQQKRLDSFSDLTAENRKNFFLSLLGYEYLDKMKPLISGDIRTEQGTITALESQSRSVASIENEIKKLNKEISDLTTRVAKGEEVTQKAKQASEKTQADYIEAAKANERVLSAKNDIQNSTIEKQKLTEDNKTLVERIAKDKELSAGYIEDSPLASRIAEAKDKAQKARDLLNNKKRREEAEGSLNVLENEYNQVKENGERLAEKTKQEPDIETPQAKLNTLNEYRAGELQRLRAGEASKKKTQDLIDNASSGKIAKCPTCGSEVSSEEGLKHLRGELENIEKDIIDSNSKLNENDKKIEATRKELEIVKMSSRTYNRDVSELNALRERIKSLTKEKKTLIQQIDEYKKKENDLKDFALGYDELSALEAEINKMTKDLQKENEMKKAFYRVREDNLTLETNNKRLEEINKTLAEKQEVLNANSKLSDSLAKRVVERDETQKKAEAYQQRLTDYKANKARMEERLASAETTLKQSKKEHDDLTAARERLEILNGAQDVIKVLRTELPSRIAPRLSIEASKLLDIATNGYYSMLELDDTYDVIVYTSEGARPLTQMSGGESDVISLCIRIAIAKLLLESKGIDGQTFILDEIFGALDDDRRASTCEALRNISLTMSKILCITHIDEIKDTADWMYSVDMDENGVSHVHEVIENRVHLFVETKEGEQQEDES